VAAGSATGDDFRARTGALTLLYVAGSMDREELLSLLEAALEGIPPPIPGEDEVADCGEELEEDEDEDEELDDEGDLLDYEEDDPGPDAQLEATAKGEEFLFVVRTIERWLGRCPQGPLELGLAGARALVPMVCSWSATLTHALAAEALTQEELERALPGLDPELVERQLESMVNSGQAEALYGSGRAPSYALTDWGREAVALIVAAVRFELRYPEQDVLPPDVFDVEAAFQMALPLLRLRPELRGTCRAGVRLPGEEQLVAGATVEVADGRVAASSALLESAPGTWATGGPLDWCETVIDPAAGGIEVGGEIGLAAGLVQALHERLFGLDR
jgi:DNA-binding HxlR family transcriptional regulator